MMKVIFFFLYGQAFDMVLESSLFSFWKLFQIAVTDFSVKEEQNAEQPTTSNVAISERTPAELAAAGDERLQQLMIESFSRESQMKPDWSRKCLMDQNWNYEVVF